MRVLYGLEKAEPVPAVADQSVPDLLAAVQDHDVVPTSKILGFSELFISVRTVHL